MKPPKFHIGQFVTPLLTDGGRELGTTAIIKMGAVYQVNYLDSYRQEGKMEWYIGCVEWPQNECGWEAHYGPVELLPDEALAELLADAFTPVTA